MSVNHIGNDFRVKLSEAPPLDLKYLDFEKRHWKKNKSHRENKDEILWNEYKRRETLRALNESNDIPRQVNKIISEYTEGWYGG